MRRRIAATEQELDITEFVLRCRHAHFTRCPRFREMITDRIGHARPHRHE